MIYCINPDCPQPKNPDGIEVCQACGTKLLLRDRYVMVKTLGQGGFGATYMAHNTSLPGEPLCVIKQLRPNNSSPQLMEMARELFEREARTLGKIGNHPQIPSLLDFFEESQQFYLVQEYIPGYTLQQEVKRDGVFSEAGVKQFLSEILPLLQYIHSQKVIHRDIKPANLIRREQDRKLVMIDFGAVKNSQFDPNKTGQGVSPDQTALTNFAIGTPGFAPPEQMAMRPVYASDFYAVGVTCIYLLTGKSPKDIEYNPATGEMMWQQYVNISDHFAKVLRKMLEASVRHRYQSVDEILRALDMEPYLDSLAQGLAFKTNTPAPPKHYRGRVNHFSSTSADLAPPSSSPSSSQVNRMAEYIRRKNQERQGHGTGMVADASSGRLKQAVNSGGKPKAPAKMDAQALLTSYGKGRRDFASIDISLANLQKADLSGRIIFNQSKMTRVNFQEANLTDADFCRANLVGANFENALLEKAFFHQANLENAVLRGAKLIGANLSQANLKNANLSGANLTGAKVSDEQLAQAKMNWLTILPNGKRAFGKM